MKDQEKKMDTAHQPTFADLGLGAPLCDLIKKLGYEAPTPIQQRSIPVLLTGKDLVGQAQTGTGKTAAFALPIMSRMNAESKAPQALVLTPTRELAIQVAEAFQTFARVHKWFHVLPIYGGQSIGMQLRQLERHPHVIVGTPGRVMDHLRRESLDLSQLTTLVLDEADEMLSMGFEEDIQSIMEQSSPERQTVLFSATMPKAIRHIAKKYLRDPEEVIIQEVASHAQLIDQSHWMVTGIHKLDALTRILEVSDTDAVLIFARTKTSTLELAEKLEARGYSAGALNGDMSQEARERTVNRLKDGKIDILVATDVAARGLHVDRINCVINYDMPFDVETYTHRIGRTGRAGRKGQAILFVSPRERGLLRVLERTTKKEIRAFSMPTREDMTAIRTSRFVDRVKIELEHTTLKPFNKIVKELIEQTESTPEKIAAALCSVLQKDTKQLFEEEGVNLPEAAPSQKRGRERTESRYGDRGGDRAGAPRSRERSGRDGGERRDSREGRDSRDRRGRDDYRSENRDRPYERRERPDRAPRADATGAAPARKPYREDRSDAPRPTRAPRQTAGEEASRPYQRAERGPREERRPTRSAERGERSAPARDGGRPERKSYGAKSYGTEKRSFSDKKHTGKPKSDRKPAGKSYSKPFGKSKTGKRK